MLSPDSSFTLNKSVWTELDFEEMSWHDTFIHGIGWSSDRSEDLKLMLDIDYMFEWVSPEPPSPSYTFWIAPCTLVFHQVSNFSCEVTDLINPIIYELCREPLSHADQVPGR